MVQPATEQADTRYRDIDLWPAADVVAAVVDVQRAALDAVALAGPALARAAEAIADLVGRGGRWAYAGAGSSGLLAQMDAIELPGTYGIEADRVPVLLAGGTEALLAILPEAEDDAEGAVRAVAALDLGPGDALVALSASGTTPYPLAALREARARGALAVGLACNAGTPLLREADHAVLVATPPEVIAGSTRMGAGTAQKCALNALSTLVGLRLGHAYAGLMVNMRAANGKLRRRAVGIVAQAAGVDETRAARALDAAGTIKPAILLCSGAASARAAQDTLAASGGHLRAALATLGTGDPGATTRARHQAGVGRA